MRETTATERGDRLFRRPEGYEKGALQELRVYLEQHPNVPIKKEEDGCYEYKKET